MVHECRVITLLIERIGFLTWKKNIALEIDLQTVCGLGCSAVFIQEVDRFHSSMPCRLILLISFHFCSRFICEEVGQV